MNFIIDLGGVVVTWQPEQLLTQLFPDASVRAGVRTHLLHHQDWIELDRGVLSPSLAIEGAAIRSALPTSTIANFLEAVPAALALIPETVELLYQLKDQGHKLYCLSNMHVDFIAYLEAQYRFWPVFDGMVVSCRVNLCKPEAAIFDYLLKTFKLSPHETLFIDDTEVNLIAAEAFGIAGILFTSADDFILRLKALNYLK